MRRIATERFPAVGASVRKPRALGLVAAAALLLSLAGCAQHARVICEPLALVYQGDDAQAVSALDATKVAESSKDRFLFHAMRGQLFQLAGDYNASNAEFEQAVAIADALEPWSVTGTLTDYAVNETLKDYAGEDYERAYLHYYLAVNYLAMNDLEGALVECRRLDEVFRKLDARYEEGTRRYQDDGFIRYLSGLIYEAEGKLDDAFIDYKLALRAYRGEAGAAVGVAPPAGLVESFVCLGKKTGREEDVEASLEEALADSAAVASATGVTCPEPSAEIVVIIENGWAPYKEEESIEVPIYAPLVPEELRGASFLAALVKIAYPVFVSIPDVGARFVVVAAPSAGGDAAAVSAAAEEVQGIDALARSSLERRIGAVKLRSTFRATAKQIALMRAKHESEEDQEKDRAKKGESTGWLGRVVRGLVEDVVTTLVAETEQADTRSWILLPRDIWIARIAVEPGEYEILVDPDHGARETLGRVNVSRGQKVFRVCRLFGAPHPMECRNGD